MKTYININNLFILLFALVTITGCKDDDSLTIAKVSKVDALYAPEDNRFINLQGQGSVIFEWQAAKASDNGIVLYDVAFDKESGDLSNPIYVIASDGKGLQNKLTLSFTQLNKIATLAGIEPENIGKLKWAIWSSKGLNITKSDVTNVLEVQRPAGFPTPDELFITGTATEGGTDKENALPFKKTGASTYEIYTSLKPGTYQFISRTTGTPEIFYINNNKIRENGETTVTEDEKVYRIQIDFSDASVTMATIDKVEMWFPPLGQFLFELNYANNGTWEALSKTIEFKQESWGRDERYKFRFTITQDGSQGEEWFGSVNADNSRPNDNTSASYWYMVPIDVDYWNHTFKFATEVDGATIDMRILFNKSVPEYTHTITIL
ncbi:MAG: hypothetical protein CSA36_05170 [Draconibacterium sp.]|nr:MAG: hypothetical protein CSA36_05170 [Draconibacterium sp.]